ncbi:MAG: prepilin-type N-terminal cleavage/methylation domain-containing protein, partial [Planctomycetes bacterium]|nr:prepilin-type N-terminal cleavage/methylation domain-containing protein [Planctomycetota bacterium]
MRTFNRNGHKRGFTLMEVMAAVMLIAIVLTVLMELRNKSVARAADGRNLA